MAPLRHLSAKLLSDRISSEWEPSMGEVTTIGLDLAKHAFQAHGVDAEGAISGAACLACRLRFCRTPPSQRRACRVAMRRRSGRRRRGKCAFSLEPLPS